MVKNKSRQPETFIFWNIASPKHVFINNQNLIRMSYGVFWQMGNTLAWMPIDICVMYIIQLRWERKGIKTIDAFLTKTAMLNVKGKSNFLGRFYKILFKLNRVLLLA